MKVIAVKGMSLDLSESMLNEDGPVVGGVVKVTAGGIFDDEERLLPLISGFLTTGLEGSMALKTAMTYGRNLGYAHTYLKSRPEYVHATLDEAFLDVPRSTLARYMNDMAAAGIESGTVRNRDATLLSFISKHLAVSVDDRAAKRSTDPYRKGFISKPPKRKLVIGCSPAELRILLDSTNLERERCVLQFMFDGGLRRSEVPRTTVGAVNDAIRFQETQFVAGKGSVPTHSNYCPIMTLGSKGRSDQIAERMSIVSRATLMRLKRYHSSPLFRRHMRKYKSPDVTPALLNAHGDPYTADSISKLLERLSLRAISNGLLKKPISPHKLRHGNAYAILASPDLGKDFLDRLVILQRSLGHRRSSTTETYTQIPNDLYNLMATNGELITRATQMEQLVAETQLRISMGDRK